MARIDREQLGELLSGYIDGELDARERQIIERVLREDESARQLLADLRRTSQAVSSLPRHAAPSSILVDTQATLERAALLDQLPEPRPHKTRGRSSWAARLAMAAMVGLVVVTGWWFTNEQARRGTQGSAESVHRGIRDFDAKVEGDSRPGVEKPTTAVASRVKENAATGTSMTGRMSAPVELGGSNATTMALLTVEQQLQTGFDPGALRNQSFAVEPVRLQVIVRDQAEREAVSSRITNSLSGQKLADLAAMPSSRADATGSGQTFYYRGKAGVNFGVADEDQILVRASPQQIDRLLTELDKPGMAGDAVAMVAGPINVQGVEKSRSVVQLLGERQRSAGAKSMKDDDGRATDEYVEAKNSDGAIPGPSPDRDSGMMEGLLKIVGIDPELLTAETESASEPTRTDDESTADSARRTASAEENAPPSGPTMAKKAAPAEVKKTPILPPSPPSLAPDRSRGLVERRMRAMTESSRGSVGKDDRGPAESEAPEAHVTVVVQIIEQSKPVESDKPAKAKLDRSPTSKTVN